MFKQSLLWLWLYSSIATLSRDVTNRLIDGKFFERCQSETYLEISIHIFTYRAMQYISWETAKHLSTHIEKNSSFQIDHYPTPPIRCYIQYLYTLCEDLFSVIRTNKNLKVEIDLKPHGFPL